MRTLWRVEGGVWFRRDTRDLDEQPMGVAVLNSESARRFWLPNRRGRLAHADVILCDKEMGGVRLDMFCRGLCDVASQQQNVSIARYVGPIASYDRCDGQGVLANGASKSGSIIPIYVWIHGVSQTAQAANHNLGGVVTPE